MSDLFTFTVTLPNLPIPAYVAIAGAAIILVTYCTNIFKAFGQVILLLRDTLYAGKVFFAMVGGMVILDSLTYWITNIIYDGRTPNDSGPRIFGIVLLSLVIIVINFLIVANTASYGQDRHKKYKRIKEEQAKKKAEEKVREKPQCKSHLSSCRYAKLVKGLPNVFCTSDVQCLHQDQNPTDRFE